ncbi:MAG: hypothetical protein ACMVP2_06945 [Imperialibacter sp.]|uniref:hypothetical protein n=1 Tax=Imperialibacter sp. TaxID=2038411 RepID=UPI003A856BE0
MNLKSFCAIHKIGVVKLDPDGKFYTTYFSKDEINRLHGLKALFYVDSGALVLGNSHADGGIQLLQPYKKEFYVSGEMEGYEYLSNPFYKNSYIQKASSINSNRTAGWTQIPTVPARCSVIDTRGSNCPFLMLSNPNFGRYIYNRYATFEYLNEILDLDELLSKQRPSMFGRLFRRN